MNHSDVQFSPNPLFSTGANQAISTLCGTGKGRFPPWLSERGDQRIREDGSIQEWFRRMIGESQGAEDRILQAAINDYFVLFGVIASGPETLKFCRLHAVIVENGDLFDLYLKKPEEAPAARYYRLDYDALTPGPIFSEPFPHIHCRPEGAPRFPLPGSAHESLPIRFIEFIYLNHFHADWVKWAEAEVKAREDACFPFKSIVEGYESGSIVARLHDLTPHVIKLRKILSRAKHEFSRQFLPISEENRQLNYFDPRGSV